MTNIFWRLINWVINYRKKIDLSELTPVDYIEDVFPAAFATGEEVEDDNYRPTGSYPPYTIEYSGTYTKPSPDDYFFLASSGTHYRRH